MSLRSRWRYHTQWKRHRLTILNLTVCRVRGHRGGFATDWFGVCDRCFRDVESW